MEPVRDWGRLAGDVVVFGGVVSNAHALEALLARRAGRPMIFTGDVTGYCGEPGRSISLMRRAGVLAIRGNCEDSLADGAGDCGCGFAPGSVCDAAAARWFAHADGEASAEDRAWMGRLPALATVTVHGRRWGVLHGGVSAVTGSSGRATPARWRRRSQRWRRWPGRLTASWRVTAGCLLPNAWGVICGSMPERWVCRRTMADARRRLP